MKIVAIQEVANGNASIGSMWLETKIFDPETPVSEIIEWSRLITYEGKLILTVAKD